MRGRPPKPTAIKLREAAYSKNPQRRNNSEPEPSNEPTPSEPLDGRAAAMWQRRIPTLIAMGVVGETDSEALTCMCLLDAAYFDDSLTYPQRLQSFDRFRHLAEQFGMTASARSRLDVRQSQPKSDLEKLMA